jgi:hypothetical protein
VQSFCLYIAPHRFRNVGVVARDAQANYDPYEPHGVSRRWPEAKPSLKNHRRDLIERHLPAEVREKQTWRHVASLLPKAAAGADTADVSVAFG